MIPRRFMAEVAQPNMEDALRAPGGIREVTNAVLSMDAFLGILFWHLHDIGDPAVAEFGDDDSVTRPNCPRTNISKFL